MPLEGVKQPRFLPLGDGLRLRRFGGDAAAALAWYQDEETVYLVDGVRAPYDDAKLARMYACLDARGELYWIERANESDEFAPIGDVTLCESDLPIVIGETRFRRQGIGRRVLTALIERARALGFEAIHVREIYAWNTASERLFRSVGFAPSGKTPRGNAWQLTLERDSKPPHGSDGAEPTSLE